MDITYYNLTKIFLYFRQLFNSAIVFDESIYLVIVWQDSNEFSGQSPVKHFDVSIHNFLNYR